MMLKAVKQNGNAIQYIAQEFRTNEIMLEAIKQNGNSIQFIAQEFRTNEMYDLIIELKQYDGFKYVPTNYIDIYYQNKYCSFELKYNDLIKQLKNILN